MSDNPNVEAAPDRNAGTPSLQPASSPSQNALNVFLSTAAAVHAQFANMLAQAGHAVNEENTASQLINVAAAASATVGKPATGVAPNYADFALSAFLVTMQQLALQFAAAHLPAKLKPIAEELDAGIRAALGAAPIAETVEKVTEVAGTVAEVANPSAAPIIAAVEPIAEVVEADVLPKADVTPQPVNVSQEPTPGADEDPQPSAADEKASLLDDTH